MTQQAFTAATAAFKHNQRVRCKINGVLGVFWLEGLIRLDEGTPNILSVKDADKHITRVVRARVASIEEVL